jgi:hypothetical protein
MWVFAERLAKNRVAGKFMQDVFLRKAMFQHKSLCSFHSVKETNTLQLVLFV